MVDGSGAHFSGVVSLVQPGPPRGSDPFNIKLFGSTPLALFVRDCTGCFFWLLAHLTDHSECPNYCERISVCQSRSTARGGVSEDVTILQRYRDEVLDGSSAGQYYIERYEEHSEAAGIAMLRRPAFLFDVADARGDWLAGLRSLVDGEGASVTISLSMQNDLLGLLDVLETEGSPELSTFLAFERGRLQLDTIAGLSMAQFQTQIETLGGTTIAESSWGKIKFTLPVRVTVRGYSQITKLELPACWLPERFQRYTASEPLRLSIVMMTGAVKLTGVAVVV